MAGVTSHKPKHTIRLRHAHPHLFWEIIMPITFNKNTFQLVPTPLILDESEQQDMSGHEDMIAVNKTSTKGL